jgi:histidine triad (HIT) family protein
MNDCIFCKIVNGEIPCHKIYEDDNFLAFLDINPVSLGHTLLIPKNHFRWVYNIPNSGELWQVAQKIAISLKESKLNPDFVSFLTMGNEVLHAHIHIIPRSLNDAIQPILRSIPHVKPTEEQFLDITNQIKNSIK